jgi:hypothetical protein
MALSVTQHWSSVVPPSSLHLLYRRSMNPPVDSSKPSPTADGWLFVVAIRPSTDCDEYDTCSVGSGPPIPGGARIGYDQAKFPDEPPADHVPPAARLVAA